jgi:hypothetical protein
VVEYDVLVQTLHLEAAAYLVHFEGMAVQMYPVIVSAKVDQARLLLQL